MASVEAGAVLGDICDTGATHSYSAPARERIAAWAGEVLPDEGSTVGLADNIVRLRRTYRYGPHSGIEALARAVGAGDAALALSVLSDARYPDVALVTLGPRGSLGEELAALIVAGYGQ